MNVIVAIKHCKFLLAFLFFSQLSFGQLSNFTLNVTPTNATCTSNGMLTFSVSGTVAGSNMDYSVYLLPNTTTPLTVVTSNSVTGLNAGNYLVVATQSLGANSGTQQQNVTIVNQIQTLTYTLIGTKVKCGNDGVITVNVTSGTAVSYEIISGPVTTPLQFTNVFSNLPVGVYQIRVFDSCGEGVVQTYTLQQALVSLIIDPVTFSTGPLPSCNTIYVNNFFGVTTGAVIAFPLTFEYTVYPPASGTPVVFTQVMNSGDTVTQEIPFYNNQSYYYDLKVTDACGNVYHKNNNIVNKKFDFDSSTLKLNCTDIALKLVPMFYVAPYTINFLTFPAGFNPVNFNANHPGPFSSIFEIYGGVGNSFPEGTYSIQMTDACGRTATKTVQVVNPTPTPIAVGSNNGCGQITILLSGPQIVSVVILNAPNTYTVPLPHDVSIYINPDGTQFFISGLPEGTYTFQVTDSCDNVTIVNATVAPYVPGNLSIIQRPGCELGYGSIIVNAPNLIASAVLINAPASYVGTVPQDLSANIDTDGVFYFGSAPQGNYTFQFTNSCGALRTDVVSVEGYQITSNTITITENCGSFNLLLQHVSNGNFLQNYWLQKYNPVSGQWTHPSTGVVYVDGTVLTSANGIFLTNNTNNLNLAFTGQFRVMKGFKSLQNGQYINCYSDIYDFEFLGGPKIDNVYAFLCTNNNNEVIVEASGGVPPLIYSITTQNNLPYVVNNGTQNSFTNLPSATYNFQVHDACGNIVNSVFDISNLDPLSVSSTIGCSGQNGALSVPLFSFLNYEWWEGNNTSTILSTSNVLNFTPYNATADAGTYHVRITNPNNSTSCVDTILDFVILPENNNPNAGQDAALNYCGTQGQIDLFSLLSGTFDTTGTWSELTSSGTLTAYIWNSTTVPFGTYHFKYRVDGTCGVFDESFVDITINEIPEMPIASASPIVCDTGILNLYATTVSNASYEWTGPNGFTSNDQNPIINPISSQNNGTYSVKSLANGCGSVVSSVTIEVTPLPEFLLDANCIDNEMTLTATAIQNSYDASTATYEWSNSQGFSSTTNPTTITGEPKGIYTVTITNSQGCSTTNSINIVSTLCSIPKGVSPNGDGSNDAFDLSGFDGITKVKIFNRYGMVVFEQDNYVNEWKGQDYNGNLLPSATYYYLVYFENGDAKTGWVYLTRE